MIERIYLEEIKERIEEKRNFIQVIYGPRQVGKTTLITQLLKKISIPYIFEAADDINFSNSFWISQIWETARFKLKTEPEVLIIIDEIQKINNWSEVIKKEWDKDTKENNNIKLIILGSSRLLIQKGLSDSLAGRFETTYLGHWSYDEMNKAFGWSLEEYIYFGGYPASNKLIKDEQRWKDYITNSLIETTISKDILMLTRVDKPALLKELFEIGSQYSGQILSFNKIIGQLIDAGNTTTLSNYLKLLSDCGLLSGLEKYSKEIIRKRSSIPKFQVHNNALISSLSNDSFPYILEDKKKWGRLVESTIGCHLVNNSIAQRYKVYYWREQSFEVDFVIEKGDKLISIEVKSGARAKNKGMSIFNSRFQPSKTLLIGSQGIPLEDFLKTNPKDLFD